MEVPCYIKKLIVRPWFNVTCFKEFYKGKTFKIIKASTILPICDHSSNTQYLIFPFLNLSLLYHISSTIPLINSNLDSSYAIL